MAENQEKPDDSANHYGGIRVEEILNMAQDLATKVAKSQMYQDYLYYKQQLNQKPGLWQKIQQIKKMQWEQGLKRSNQEVVPFEEEANLSKLYSEIMLDEDARNFWNSRKQMIQLESQIIQMITNKAPIDMTFLQEMK